MKGQLSIVETLPLYQALLNLELFSSSPSVQKAYLAKGQEHLRSWKNMLVFIKTLEVITCRIHSYLLSPSCILQFYFFRLRTYPLIFLSFLLLIKYSSTWESEVLFPYLIYQPCNNKCQLCSPVSQRSGCVKIHKQSHPGDTSARLLTDTAKPSPCYLF